MSCSPTASWSPTAAVASLIAGTAWHGVDLTRSMAALGWLALTALFGQVLGGSSWPVRRAAPVSDVGAALLILPRSGARARGRRAGERPTVLQLTGAVVMLIARTLPPTTRSGCAEMMRRDQS